MGSRANYFKIGLFVIAATAIAVIAAIVLGAGALLQDKFILETYIEESVQGLDVGSPVKFRGVQIGNVEDITIVSKEYLTNRRYVLVRASLFPDAFRIPPEQAVAQGLGREVEKGLRVRLASQGLTGTAYLEADYLDPQRNPPLEIDWQPRNPYVPSSPSTVTRLSDSVDRLFRTLEEIDVQGITEGMENSLRAVTNLAQDAHIEKISNQVEQLLVEIRDTNRRVGAFLKETKIEPVISDFSATVATARRIVESSQEPIKRILNDLPETSAQIKSLTKKLDSVSDDLPETVALLKRTLRRVDTLVSSQQQDILVTIENIRLISSNLKELTETAKKYPAQVLFGQPPAPSDTGNP